LCPLPNTPGSVTRRAPSLPGGACGFADFADHPLQFGGAAGMTGFRVLMIPGDFLCYHGEGRCSGENCPAQLPRTLDLELHGFCALRRCPSLRPFPALERGHKAIGLVRAGRQQIRRVPKSLRQAPLLALYGRAELSCALVRPQLALTDVTLVAGRCSC